MNKTQPKWKVKSLRLFSFLKRSYFAWDSIDPFAKSAIIAYYTLFSLPSLLMIVTAIAGYFLGQEAVTGRISGQIGSYIGPDAAEAVEGMISNAALTEGNWITITVGIGALVYGATGVFFQMKKAMNEIWNVREKKQNWKRMLKNRLLSFGMVLILAFMLLVSLVLSAALAALSTYIEYYAPTLAAVFADILRFLLSFAFIAALFAAIFKILPDVVMSYKTTFLGASITAVLFLIGEYALGYYFTSSNPASVYGGAASIVLILLWVNYTCLILFFGAEITVQYALASQHKIVPNDKAEMAYLQDMRDLEERQKKAELDKKKAEELKNNSETT
ncbi:YihY/virulence factor BrkB family protein [Flavimarina sp. Hel_I_48]|uniref:YihY/virulence factor BrkB family protein n=1 Tax=Flavimarina sp. Hel_I_48 TaxID=1392488 RepID=UPI0004DEF29E|nr:YihY/virulence factor BrkB family protein [Flavimarina sp. Hel_I_48]